MPNWKKLVVSGSDAHLNSLNVATSVTASFLKGDGSAITNITASYFGAGLVTASNDFTQVTFTKDSGDTFLLDTTPNHVHELVKSKEAFTMVKGTPVYVSGSTGNAGHVYAASASRADRMPAAYVLDEDLTFDQEGYALLAGFINNVDTSQFAAGDSVYVGANGGYTNVKPTGSNFIQKLGNVIKVDAANGSGVITGAGRANDVPNISENYLWIGNADGVATPVSTGSLSGSFTLLSDYTTASSSLSTRVTTNETNISNLQTASGSFSTRVNTNESDISNLQTASGSFSTRVTANESNISSLTAATGSYLLNSLTTQTGNLKLTGDIQADTVLSGSTVRGGSFQVAGGSQVIDGNSNIYAAEYIYHTGDVDTYIQFINDGIQLYSGGQNGIRLDNTFGTVINTFGANRIFRVESDTDENAIYVDGSTGRVGIGTASPTAKLTVSGSIEPQTTEVFDLGSSSKRWRDLYLSGSTIYLGNATISETSWTDISGSIAGKTLISGSAQLANETIPGDLTVTGKVTAQEFHTEFVSSSIIYQSGSTKFGDTSDDIHQFTGSLSIQSGSISLKDDYNNIVIGEGASAETPTQLNSTLNVVIGKNAGNPDDLSISKTGNVVIGESAKMPRGGANVLIGRNVMANSGTSLAASNVAIGAYAMQFQNGANENVAVGYTAGTTLSSGDRNILIGYSADPAAGTDSDSIVIGHAATGKGSNTTYIGKPGTTTHTYLEGLITGSSLEIGGDITGSNALFNGTVNATGDVVAYYSSDERFKDNIVEIENAVEKVESIRGVEFDWNDKQDTYTGHDIGVIAQEVEAILPEIVATRDNGYKAVKYEKLTALLLTAVKELSERVKTLEGK